MTDHICPAAIVEVRLDIRYKFKIRSLNHLDADAAGGAPISVCDAMQPNVLYSAWRPRLSPKDWGTLDKSPRCADGYELPLVD